MDRGKRRGSLMSVRDSARKRTVFHLQDILISPVVRGERIATRKARAALHPVSSASRTPQSGRWSWPTVLPSAGGKPALPAARRSNKPYFSLRRLPSALLNTATHLRRRLPPA